MRRLSASINPQKTMHSHDPIKLLITVLIYVATTAHLQAATYYVNNAPNTGNDTRTAVQAQNINTPWKTVKKAADSVTGPGPHTIQVAAGTYAETNTINLAVGVSLVGAGYGSTIITTSAAMGSGTVGHLVKLFSSSVTSGNQSIAGIKFDGKSFTVNQGIEIDKRSNVTLSGIWMENFGTRAVYISNTSVPANTLPTSGQYLNNIRIVHSTFKNSANVPAGANWGWGSVNAYHVSNSVFRHCTLDESGVGAPMPNNVGGFNFKGSWVKGLKVHNCILLQRPFWPNSTRNKGFSLEFQNSLDCEFFDNWCNGTISFSADNSKIFHNTVVMTGEGAHQGLEAMGINTVVANNYVEGALPGMYSGGSGSSGMTIHHNVFRECGGGVFIYETGTGSGANNMKVHNNTFDLCGPLWNTLEGAVTARVQTSTGRINNLSIRNNLFTNLVGGIRGIALTGTNGHSSNADYISGTVIDRNIHHNVPPGFLLNQGAVNTTNTNNSGGDPLYVGGATAIPSPYFRLKPGSPAISTGGNVGLTYLAALPDKGAYVEDVNTANAKIEAEMSYTVAADVGAATINVAGYLNADSFKSVNLNDPGDSIRVHFYVASAGNYNVRVRLRSGFDSSPTFYWPNGYAFQLDSAIPITLSGDAVLGTVQDSGGNVRWGTMRGTVSLTEGPHHLTITTNPGFHGGTVDYIQVK